MPSNEQLNNMALTLGYGSWTGIYAVADKVKVMELTIAAMQAKALADLAYLYGFSGGKVT